MKKTKQYTPTIDFLLSMGMKKIRVYKHERYSISIPGNPVRSLYYFPLYNSFRYAGMHFYPDTDSDVEVIIRTLSFKK